MSSGLTVVECASCGAEIMAPTEFAAISAWNTRTGTGDIRIDLGWLQAMICPSIGWFRVFGYGLHWGNLREHGMLFSTLNGYENCLIVGGWKFKFLLPRSR